MYFNFGSRKEQNIFTHLRFKCSSLIDHLLKNIIDSGLCTCGKIETNAQYLLQVQIIYLLGTKPYIN